MDAGEEDEEDRHHVVDLDILLNHADDADEVAAQTEEEARAQRVQDIEEMRRMAAMVNEAMGGDG